MLHKGVSQNSSTVMSETDEVWEIFFLLQVTAVIGGSKSYWIMGCT